MSLQHPDPSPSAAEESTGHRLQFLSRGGLQTFSVKVVAIALGFASHMLLANLLGKVGYGEFAFAVTTLQFLVIVAVLGADSVATRFLSRYQDTPTRLLRHTRWLNRRTLRLAMGFAVAGAVVFQIVRQFDGRAIWFATQMILIALPLQAFAMLRQGMLRGLKRPVLSVLPEGILRPFFTIKFALAFVFFVGVTSTDEQFSNQFESWHAVVVYILATVVTLIAGQIFLIWCLPGSADVAAEKLEDPDSAHVTLLPEQDPDAPQWKSMAWASMFATLAMTIHSQSDVWMLGVLTSGEEVGPYSIAVKYAGFVIFGIDAVNTAFGPLIARAVTDQGLITDENRTELQHLATRAAAISFGLGILVSLVLVLAPGFFLGLFGSGFRDADRPLQLLVIANLFNVACGSVGLLLSMSGNHTTFMKILLSSVILNIVLNAILIPPYGMFGAAVATGISIVYWNLVALVFVRIKLDIRPSIGGLV